MIAAFVFPGQGSQSVGMLGGFGHSEIVSAACAEASQVLGFDLWEVISEGPRERLDQTEITQPAMLAAGVATWRTWCEAGGPPPRVMAGHSLGEYTALVCSGAVDFAAAVGLVQQRARAMQQAVPAGTGAMAAVLGLDDAAVEQACRAAAQSDEIVEPVNYNAPGQVVIAGHVAAVERAITAAQSAGARRAVLLPVSVPSHSSLMQPASAALQQALDDTPFGQPQLEVVSSVDARVYTSPEQIRSNLVAQVHRPVRWGATIETMVGRGCDLLVECGPGKVLTGLNRRIIRGSEVQTGAIVDKESLENTLAKLVAGS